MSASSMATGEGPRGAMAPVVDSFAFDEERSAEVERILTKYPPERRQSAVLPLLHLAQAQHGGWLPRAILDHVAGLLGMPRIRVYEVATFYDMFNTEPVGRIQIRVCTTTPCWLCGSDDVVRAARDALGIDIGESTEDGRFYLREFECLGACCNAPMMWIDDQFYEDLDYDKAKAVIEALEKGETPEPGPQSERIGSEPAGERTTLTERRHPKEEPPAKPRADGEDSEPERKARPQDTHVDPHDVPEDAHDGVVGADATGASKVSHEPGKEASGDAKTAAEERKRKDGGDAE
ncbi:MAG: NADH-quinone oxidoreductase subunit NuoE [Geminicoccaceae bacterium]|nr:NADH-quinone oxidoreductase subunit NuoE [Geminicoccaceae bacterium]